MEAAFTKQQSTSINITNLCDTSYHQVRLPDRANPAFQVHCIFKSAFQTARAASDASENHSSTRDLYQPYSIHNAVVFVLL